MIKKLRRKFIAISMGSMAAVLSLLIGGMNVLNYHSMISDLEMRLNIISENNGNFPVPKNDNSGRSAENGMEDGDKEFLQKYGAGNPSTDSAPKEPGRMNHFGKNFYSEEDPFDTRYFTVTLKPDGTVVTVDTGKIATVSTTDASDYAVSLFESGKTSGMLSPYRYRMVSAPGNSNENVMYIFLYCGRELNSFRNSLISSVGASLLGMLLVYILVVFFSKLLVRPVAESYDKQKRFITDASHELKTPLTIIDANTEVLEMETGENEWTKSIHNQVKRLSSLTQKLVLLSRMDEGNASAFHMTDFSLSEAVDETAKSFEAVAETRETKLDISIVPNLSLNGDEAAIRQLVSLLMDNALKYSPQKGAVRLSLKQAGRNKILTVWNTAENVSAGKQDILFDRFYRAETSRNSKSGGFGIGLSVAQAIVLAHKGKISARSEDGKSLEIKVIL